MSAITLLRLTRFPLIFTAVADSTAGYLLSRPEGTLPLPLTLFLLAGASSCLYACGMVFNDVADVLRDRVLHPQRPLPSKQVSVIAARRFGLLLMFVGAFFACAINFMAGQIVLLIFVLILAYNFFTKAYAFAGAFTMGLVRMANFILGIFAAVPRDAGLVAVPDWSRGAYVWAMLLGVYVAVLTLMSVLEERPRSMPFLLCAIGMGAVPLAGLLLRHSPEAVGLAMALAVLILGHAVASVRALDRSSVMRNVRWGVLAIIGVDASFVMSQGPLLGAGVLGLALPALVLLPLFRRLNAV